MSYEFSENVLVQESAGRLLRDELGISEYRRRVYEYVYTHYEGVA